MNFVIEGGLNFNEMLEDEGDVCLITGDKLEESVTLTCGHKFNNNSIFKEIFNQKISLNFKNDIPLKDNEFKCPYCRSIQKKLLPINNMPTVFRVNTLDTNYEVDPKLCHFDNLKSFNLGTCGFPLCTKKYVFYARRLKTDVCVLHSKLTNTELTRQKKIHKYKLLYPNEPLSFIYSKIDEESEKCGKPINLTEKLKAKEEAKKAKAEEKLKAKEDAKKAKTEEKLKAKEYAKKAKEEAKKAKAEEKLKAKEEAKKAKAEEKLKAKEDAKKAKEVSKKAKTECEKIVNAIITTLENKSTK